MSCYGCGSGFGAFKKEHGCKNCGFAFCTKCLPNKLPIAKLNNEKHRVCTKCYNILTGKVKPKEDTARYSPPENFKKRMAALEEREGSRGHHAGGKVGTDPRSHGGTTHVKGQTKGISKADKEIQQRLEKLKEKTPQEVAASNVSNTEIDDRLARLRGMDPSRYNSKKPAYQPPDRRTQQEQMNDLLDEIGNEVELDSRLPDPAQEIAARLARLKGQDNQEKQNGASPDSDENNLNKPSMRDSQTFSQNIGSKGTQNAPPPSSDSANENKASGSSGGDEAISVEDVSRILNEASHELEMDAQKALQGLQEDKEIMKRLQQVKQRRKESTSDINKDENIDNSDSENEEADLKLAENIIEQAMEESKLDEAAAKDGIDTHTEVTKATKKKTNASADDDSDEWDDPDELPYCCICTEDATVRCFGCDRDLYCHKCFSEGHKELGLTDHASIKYTPPKEKT